MVVLTLFTNLKYISCSTREIFEICEQIYFHFVCEEKTKTNIVHLDDLYNYVVENFFI